MLSVFREDANTPVDRLCCGVDDFGIRWRRFRPWESIDFSKICEPFIDCKNGNVGVYFDLSSHTSRY